MFGLLWEMTVGLQLALPKKTVKKRIFYFIGIFAIILFASGCGRSEAAFLELDQATLTTNKQGKAIIEGKTNQNGSLMIDGKTIKLKEGKFAQGITLKDKEVKIVKLVSRFEDQEMEKEVIVKPAKAFVEQLERDDAETLLKLAESKPTDKNYDEAATLISSLSREYDDFNDRLHVIKDHVSIYKSVELAEKEQTREHLDAAITLVSKATLNKSDLDQRLETIQKNVTAKEEVERKVTAAQTAVEKAEQELTDGNYNDAVKLVGALPDENVQLKERTQQVKQKLDAKKEEERRQAEAAKAAEAERIAQEEQQRAAESAQQADTGNQQIVLVTRTGSKYHTHKCGNGTYYEATLAEAQARNLTPCSKCY